ncbi:MAG: methionine--tRNA ligase, partial [Balneolaceae bacterium]|nr:methionine--tRNA ligase [Balneolaceae bacterium]
YFTETEPWKTRKENPQACANTLYVCSQITAALSVLFEPVLPGKMSKLREQIGVPSNTSFSDVSPSMLPTGQVVSQGEILFEKIEDETVDQQIDILKERAAEASSDSDSDPYEKLKKETDFGVFSEIDLRAGRIVEASPVEKSKKLIQITVDLGFEKRTILSGIAQDFDADEIVGRSVVVVANLAPKKMMGIESNGMILMGEDREGRLHFVETDAEPGSPVM